MGERGGRAGELKVKMGVFDGRLPGVNSKGDFGVENGAFESLRI